MSEDIPLEVIQALIIKGSNQPNNKETEINIEKIGNGLINQSFKINIRSSSNIFLQKINKVVFPNPSQIQENYMAVWKFNEQASTGVRLPTPMEFEENKTLFTDKSGDYWRAFEFIDNTKSYNTASTPNQAAATAKTFAYFTKVFSDFNHNQLQIVIPGFHDLNFRYQQFLTSLESTLRNRIEKAALLIIELKTRKVYVDFYNNAMKSNAFIKRVMHHDAKISNVLFDKKTDNVIGAVDLDTVMPGYIFSDLGDMIRSMVSSVDETNTDLKKISIRKDFYETIVSGYIEIIGEQLTSAEKEHIHFAGLFMIYMQALRFITDYLNGDNYYQITYTEQNYDRAKNQFTLLNRLEEFLTEDYNYSIK